MEDLRVSIPDQIEPEIASPLENLIQERSNYAAARVISGLVHDQIDDGVFFGLMAGGKSTALKRTVNILTEIWGAENVHTYKWSQDIRGNNGTTKIMIRGDHEGLPATPVEHISGIIADIKSRKIKPGQFIASSETQFLGSADEIAAFRKLARSREIKTVTDFLGSWFNTLPVDQVLAYLNSGDPSRTLAFCFQGYDSFNPSRFAEMTMRGVGIAVDLETGEISDEIIHRSPDGVSDANYYERNGIDVRQVAKT